MKKLLCFGVLAFCLAGCSDDPAVDPDRQTKIIRGVNYVGVSVSNLERAVALYAEAGDLKPVKSGSLENSDAIDALAGRSGAVAKTQLMKSVNGQLQFMQFANPSAEARAASATPVNGPGIAHVCYQVDKQTGAYERFLSGGAKPIGNPELVQLNPDRPVEYGYIKDQDSIVVEIEHVDISKLNLPEPPKNKYRLRHVALATPDIDRIVDFYSVLLEDDNPRRFGWWSFGLSGEVFDQVSGFKDTEIKMAWFQIRNMELEIGEYLNPAVKGHERPKPIDALGYNMIVFDVSDIELARQKFLEAGGTIETSIEAMDGGHIVFGRDPDGNIVGLQVTPPGAAVSAQNFEDNGI